MEEHEHKRQLAQMQADRIAGLELKLRLRPNKLLKKHLDLIKCQQGQKLPNLPCSKR